MTIAKIIATRTRLNIATRYRLNMNATRPIGVYPAPLAWLTR